MLRALYAVWNETPPAHLQLARIATMLGREIGVKPPSAKRAPGAQASRPEPTGDELAVLEGMPTAPITRYLTPEEYLAQRDAERE